MSYADQQLLGYDQLRVAMIALSGAPEDIELALGIRTEALEQLLDDYRAAGELEDPTASFLAGIAIGQYLQLIRGLEPPTAASA